MLAWRTNELPAPFRPQCSLDRLERSRHHLGPVKVRVGQDLEHRSLTYRRSMFDVGGLAGSVQLNANTAAMITPSSDSRVTQPSTAGFTRPRPTAPVINARMMTTTSAIFTQNHTFIPSTPA